MRLQRREEENGEQSGSGSLEFTSSLTRQRPLFITSRGSCAAATAFEDWLAPCFLCTASRFLCAHEHCFQTLLQGRRVPKCRRIHKPSGKWSTTGHGSSNAPRHAEQCSQRAEFGTDCNGRLVSHEGSCNVPVPKEQRRSRICILCQMLELLARKNRAKYSLYMWRASRSCVS